ncbi:MAG: S9 family peptidase [Candidatus Zophobacter franzmannii]|nr:S9 family peptidase [Candidatus Zophobacter franzmannii]
MKKVTTLLWLILLFGVVSAIDLNLTKLNKKLSPPIAKRSDYFYRLHNHHIRDPYHWLKDKERSNPDVIDYIEEENVYAGKMMEHTRKMQETLYNEMTARMQQNDMSIPTRIDEYFYYFREEEGKEYSLYCRKKDSLENEEEILLDVNKLAEGKEYYSVDTIAMSPNHRYLAYSVDNSGSEIYTLYIKDLEDDRLLPDSIYAISSMEWSNDNSNMFYTADNLELNYTDKIYRHTLGANQSEDKLILSEPDARYYMWIYKTKSKKYLIAGSSSKTTDQIYYAEADDAHSPFRLLRNKVSGIKYSVSHRGDEFYIQTNDSAPNYRIVKTPVFSPTKDNWEDVIPTSKNTYIEYFNLFQDYLIVHELKNGQPLMHVYNMESKDDYYIKFNDPAYDFYTTGNANFDTDILRFSYESFTAPKIIYDYNLETQEKVVRKHQDIPTGYNHSDYKSERIYAIANDGTEIPISLVYKKSEFHQDGSNPLLLEGYGAYGDRNSPYFSTSRLSLLNRGFIYATAHVRGGGDKGDSWYEQGKMFNKKNTFSDFISCAEELIESQYTSSEDLVIKGGSAGGLLIGAVLNQRPDICKIAIAEVPFVDIINTMLDTTLVATVSEYEEWGNPKEKKYFDYMSSYCPYTNVRPQPYPHILVLAGFYDPRVNYWEPAKWVAKLRYSKTDSNVILLRTSMSGHQGASGRYQYYEELAFQYSFIFDILCINR